MCRGVYVLRKLAKDYDPTNRDAEYENIRAHQRKGEGRTGLLYISPDSKDVHDQNDTVPGSLYNLPYAQLCPGNDALQKLTGGCYLIRATLRTAIGGVSRCASALVVRVEADGAAWILRTTSMPATTRPNAAKP